MRANFVRIDPSLGMAEFGIKSAIAQSATHPTMRGYTDRAVLTLGTLKFRTRLNWGSIACIRLGSLPNRNGCRHYAAPD